MPKVSVIVPVYNTAEYVERAIVSLMEQTLDDVEFIIIDDGSKDDSLNIIKQVMIRYPLRQLQTILISRKNKGVAATRTQGILLATGDYIIYLDSDDWADINWLEVMYSKAVKDNADVVVCQFRSIGYKRELIITQDVASTGLKCVRNLLVGKISNSNWNKLVKKNIFSENRIQFTDDISMGEDFLVSLEVFLHSGNVYYIDRPLYNYNRQNVNSVTKVFNDKSLNDLLKVVDKVESIFLNTNLDINDEVNEFKINIRNAYVLNSNGSKKIKNRALKLYPESNYLIDKVISCRTFKMIYWLNKYKLSSLFWLVDVITILNKKYRLN